MNDEPDNGCEVTDMSDTEQAPIIGAELAKVVLDEAEPNGPDSISWVHGDESRPGTWCAFYPKLGMTRPLTDDEMRKCVRGPYLQIEDMDPDDARRVFAEEDGELFAAFAERRRAVLQQDKEAAARALDRIATTPAETDTGAAWQLSLVAGSYCLGNLTEAQKQTLIWSAMSWLHDGTRTENWERREPQPELAEHMAEFLEEETAPKEGGAS